MIKTISVIPIYTLVFCLAFQSPAAWSSPSAPCKVLISDFKEGSSLSVSEFRDLDYRIVGKGDTEVNPVGHLRDNELALGFDLDGSMKIYYGGLEAMLDRRSELTFEVIPVDHQLDISRHDMVFIYRKLEGTEVLKAVKQLFDYSDSEHQVISGYNQVAAVCNIMRADNCEETEPLQYHLDKLVRELVVLAQNSKSHRPIVFVSAEAKSPERFLNSLSGMDVSDRFRVAQRNENIFLLSFMGFATTMLITMMYALFFSY